MSSKNETDDTTMLCCASCGTAAVDDVKLKKCACGLVKYCGIACQKDHRSKHKNSCKKKLAELRHEILFKQPDSSHLGDCPICYLPLPIDLSNAIATCCCKIVCNGCEHANQMREIEAGLEQRCAFCREPVPETEEERHKQVMKRVKKNDPAAMSQIGSDCFHEGDYETALEYLTKAAELGDAGAHHYLSIMHWKGQGVEKDEKKEIYHLEEAAIGGHPGARHNLGCNEADNGRYERAEKHFIIAANLGLNNSLKCIKDLHTMGHASKEEYAGALRAYQTAVEATKSQQREEAEAYYKARKI